VEKKRAASSMLNVANERILCHSDVTSLPHYTRNAVSIA